MAQREATDEWLMCQVAAGNEQTLEQLMVRYHDSLLSFIHRQTDLEAEDIYQEAWLRVARNAKKYNPGTKFSSWIFKITCNLCRDAHRRRAARVETVALQNAETVASPQESTETDMLRSGMERLTDSDRELLALRYYLGFKETEVAEILGVPVGTVKSRTHHAVRRLKTMINPAG